VLEAAYLWNDLEPNAGGRNTQVSAWVDAFCGAIREGKVVFIPRVNAEYQGRRRDDMIQYQQDNPDSSTQVAKTHLLDFAKKNNYHPKFLES
jgi:hypothetical protein